MGTRHYEGVGNQLHYPLQSYQQSALPPWGPGDSDPQKEKELCGWLRSSRTQKSCIQTLAQHLQGMALTTALKEAVRPLEAAWKPVVIHMGKQDVLLIISPQEFQIKKYVGLCSSWMVSTVVPGLCPRCQKSTELKNVVHKQSFTGNLWEGGATVNVALQVPPHSRS